MPFVISNSNGGLDLHIGSLRKRSQTWSGYLTANRITLHYNPACDNFKKGDKISRSIKGTFKKYFQCILIHHDIGTGAAQSEIFQFESLLWENLSMNLMLFVDNPLWNLKWHLDRVGRDLHGGDSIRCLLLPARLPLVYPRNMKDGLGFRIFAEALSYKERTSIHHCSRRAWKQPYFINNPWYKIVLADVA